MKNRKRKRVLAAVALVAVVAEVVNPLSINLMP